jgi:hypothetical protein
MRRHADTTFEVVRTVASVASVVVTVLIVVHVGAF